MMQRLGVVIRKMNSKVKLQLAGDTDVLITFQKCFNFLLMHRNLIIKLVMRSRGFHLYITKYCVVRQSQVCTGTLI